VRGTDIGVAPNKEVVQQFAEQERFGVVLAPEVMVYADPLFQTPLMELNMGTRLNDLKRGDAYVTVTLPHRNMAGQLSFKTGYIHPQADIAEGFLQLTRRHVLQQAFKLYGAPYGWGGIGKWDDCSGYMVRIFKTFGITLPRNSGEQARAGYMLAQFTEETPLSDRQSVLHHAPEAVSFAALNGHIMLFLGQARGEFWSLHAPWTEIESGQQGDRTVAVRRVVVSPFRQGRGTQVGSYLERLVSVNALVPNHDDL